MTDTPKPARATPAATPLREANQQRVDAAAQRVRQAMDIYPLDDTFRKDVELLIEIALAPVLEIFAAPAQPAATPMAPDTPGKLSDIRLIALLVAGWDHDTMLDGPTFDQYEIHRSDCRRCQITAALRLPDAVAMNSEAPQKLPAAAQPQRESEQPEQARREALEEAAVEVLKWSEFDDSTTQKSILCQKITRLIVESIRALADTSPNSVTKAALSPQTDSLSTQQGGPQHG